MKMAMESFCSLRMVSEYETRFYNPAAERYDLLLANKAEEAGKLAAQLKRLRTHWEKIQIKPPVMQTLEPYRVGDSFPVNAEINLADLTPDEVDVELYYGNLKSLEELSASHIEPMKVQEDFGNGNYLYGCTLKCDVSGRFGFTARVSPRGDERIKSAPRLMTWA